MVAVSIQSAAQGRSRRWSRSAGHRFGASGCFPIGCKPSLGGIVGPAFVAPALIFSAGPVLAQAVRILRDGSKPCPSGYTAAGSYCAPVSANSRQAIDRPTGGTCPHGWSPSGSGCFKNRGARDHVGGSPRILDRFCRTAVSSPRAVPIEQLGRRGEE